MARMGGDEFVITAPGLTAEAATEKADRLNQAAIEVGTACMRAGCDHAERGNGVLSGRWVLMWNDCWPRPTAGCIP